MPKSLEKTRLLGVRRHNPNSSFFTVYPKDKKSFRADDYKVIWKITTDTDNNKVLVEVETKKRCQNENNSDFLNLEKMEIVTITISGNENQIYALMEELGIHTI